MKLEIREGLPFAIATLAFRGKQIELANILIDTGSAGTIFSIDLEQLEIYQLNRSDNLSAEQ